MCRYSESQHNQDAYSRIVASLNLFGKNLYQTRQNSKLSEEKTLSILSPFGTMFNDYVQTAIAQAQYEFLTDDAVFYGEIEGFQGVYATGSTIEACRKELIEVLEEVVVQRYMIGLSCKAREVVGNNKHFRYDLMPKIGL